MVHFSTALWYIFGLHLTVVPCTLFEKVSFPQKAKEILGWEAKHNLEDMCKSSWNWQSKNSKGYGK